MTTRTAIWALGTMSGTSLDGVDAALIETDGKTILGFGETAYRPYTDKERAVIQSAFGAWEGGEAATEIVETAHAELCAPLVGDAQLIGFHGQTVAHDPVGRGTRQLGDGRLLSAVLERDVIWDFRSADIEMGGQGAPLAPFYHHACARYIGAEAPVAFLNMGGVGNLTLVDPRIETPEVPGALLAFDTGPANAPLNDLMMARRGQAVDTDGALAATGQVSETVLDAAMGHRYFAKMPPKSLDRNAFHDLIEALTDLGDADAAATLTAVAAASAARATEHCPVPPQKVLVTGGGRKNPVLMAMLAAGFDVPVHPVEEVGLDGDMLEAQAFGYLAVRVLMGLPTSAPGTTGVAALVGGGQIARAASVG